MEVVDLLAAGMERAAADLSSELLRMGWRIYRSVPSAYPSWLERDGLRIAILQEYEGLGEVAIQLAIKEWQGDWSAPDPPSDYVQSILSGYPAEIEESRRIGQELIASLSSRYSVSLEDYVRSDETFAFVFAESWRVGEALLILGVEHLDPDDTPIELNLYVCR